MRHLVPTRAHSLQILDLLAEDNRLNVYAGELEVRPPGAPTTNPLAARKPPRPGTHAVRLRHESERSGRSTADQRRSVLSRGWNAGRADYYSPILRVTEETLVISPHPLLGEP